MSLVTNFLVGILVVYIISFFLTLRLFLNSYAVKMSTKLEQIPDSSVSKDDDQPKSKVLTFSYRELATATNNFRQESLVGECGFGSVYQGKLESTGQVIFC